MRANRAIVIAVAALGFGALGSCSDDEASDSATGGAAGTSGNAGKGGGSAGSSGGSVAGKSGSGGAVNGGSTSGGESGSGPATGGEAGNGSPMGGAAGEAGASAGGQNGDGGMGGAAGAAGSANEPWPECNGSPIGAVEAFIPDIWEEDPPAPKRYWVSTAYVSAVSYGQCIAGVACRIFVQQRPSFASLNEASHAALKIDISAEAAEHFVAVRAGDELEIDGYAWRYTLLGQNELQFRVTTATPGCARITASGTLEPVDAPLPELTIEAYEQFWGPVLVRVPGLSGTPGPASQSFLVHHTGEAQDPAAPSLSPACLSSAVFAGLVEGVATDFLQVVGVFGLDVVSSTKYPRILPRSASDYPIAPP